MVSSRVAQEEDIDRVNCIFCNSSGCVVGGKVALEGISSLTNLALALAYVVSSVSTLEFWGSVVAAIFSTAPIGCVAVASGAFRCCGAFCVRKARSLCMGNCGCPGCGCPQGAHGCGSLGRSFCSWWEVCCGLQNSSLEFKKNMQKVQDRYGLSLLCLALSSLGLEPEKVLSGEKKVLLAEVELACLNVAKSFLNTLVVQNPDTWASAAAAYEAFIDDSLWKECIVSAIACPEGEVNEHILSEKVRILVSLGDGSEVCNTFDVRALILALLYLPVFSHKDSSEKTIGALQVAYIVQLVAKMLYLATGEGKRPIWLHMHQLLSLVSIALANYDYSIVPHTGDPKRSHICRTVKFQLLIENALQQRLAYYRNKALRARCVLQDNSEIS
ncbi:hypothetical protein [Chlamydia pecorum]|nr:hypothetical protein [Chlamydia pecorum]